MKLCKLLLAAVGATVLLGALVSSASAGRLSVTSQNIRAAFREVRFHLPGATTVCQVTLEGSMHSRTMVKTIGTLMGYITSAILGPCAEGTATILRETLPWHVRYSGIEGTLPRITSLITHVVGAAWRVRESGGINCLARSSEREPVTGRYHIDPNNGSITGVSILGSIRTGFECIGISGSFVSDNPRPTVLNAATEIMVTLI